MILKKLYFKVCAHVCSQTIHKKYVYVQCAMAVDLLTNHTSSFAKDYQIKSSLIFSFNSVC